MVRFFYKQQGQGVNAKILKDIKFPLVFDAFDLCTKRLQEKLTPIRGKFKELEDAAASEGKSAKDKHKAQQEEKKTTRIPYSFQDGEDWAFQR
jgi:ubiquitin carboxyl-terminal hydrolase 14